MTKSTRIYSEIDEIKEILSVVLDKKDFEAMDKAFTTNDASAVALLRSDIDERYYFFYKYVDTIMLLQADNFNSFVAYMKTLLDSEAALHPNDRLVLYDKILESYTKLMKNINEYLVNKNSN